MTRRVMNSAERGREAAALSEVRVYRHDNLTSQSGGSTTGFDYELHGITFRRGKGFWKTNLTGMNRLNRAWRLGYPTHASLAYVRFIDDFPVTPITDLWTDTQTGAFTDEKLYVVQTNTKVIERCILMTTDPGDLVLDPTCGSGTTAYVAEQWGRRWITIDTSRVALALARARIMGARYPYYLLADSREGQLKEAEVTHTAPSSQPTRGDIRQGFVYERVPHITLKSITNNAEIDVIWEQWQAKLEPLREALNTELQASPGRSGRSRARQTPGGQPRRSNCMLTGGRRALRGNRRSMPLSPPRPSSNISTTGPMTTRGACVLPGRSPWKACRRIACWGWMSTTS